MGTDISHAHILLKARSGNARSRNTNLVVVLVEEFDVVADHACLVGHPSDTLADFQGFCLDISLLFGQSVLSNKFESVVS